MVTSRDLRWVIIQRNKEKIEEKKDKALIRFVQLIEKGIGIVEF